MERWEHMAVIHQDDPETVFTLTPSGERRRPLLDRSGPGVVVEYLNQLGTEGWHLVSTDFVVDARDFTETRTFWLKRQLQ